MIISFDTLSDNCSHRGMIKEGRYWCSFKDGKRATCWDDWQVCCPNNCPLVTRKNKNAHDQMSLEDYMEVTNG